MTVRIELEWNVRILLKEEIIKFIMRSDFKLHEDMKIISDEVKNMIRRQPTRPDDWYCRKEFGGVVELMRMVLTSDSDFFEIKLAWNEADNRYCLVEEPEDTANTRYLMINKKNINRIEISERIAKLTPIADDDTAEIA